jgi:hypothetical protein
MPFYLQMIILLVFLIIIIIYTLPNQNQNFLSAPRFIDEDLSSEATAGAQEGKQQNKEEGFTVVINTFRRNNCLERVVNHWLSCNVTQVRVVWPDPESKVPDFFQDLPQVVVNEFPGKNLTYRFYPSDFITDAIFQVDDDYEVIRKNNLFFIRRCPMIGFCFVSFFFFTETPIFYDPKYCLGKSILFFSLFFSMKKEKCIRKCPKQENLFFAF